ncbi:hypothetical protein DES53_106251 [Roseimicrobium gellanilyticum]|uniref:Uncharacterized protein n=1 Tax=Roseimicrobium gellanilyticum TaxID=748857 RepID=A0A366HIQ3_9BACT|nr:hypothetical protein [Roseimicrobium gellanilyticum]RBP42542.1 hypothetical protein DES53_106251 [Roseimicrobium gellanilyticum]
MRAPPTCVRLWAGLSLVTGFTLATGFLHQVAAATGTGNDTEILARDLGGTRWFWHGREDRVLELRKDGTFDLEDWKQQGISAIWKATGPKQVTVTVVSQKFRNLTATLDFDTSLNSFTGKDLDQKRAIAPSPRIAVSPGPGGGHPALTKLLGGTQWYWHGKKDRVLEFRKDGNFQLADWAQQGISAVWQASGEREVTVTVTSAKFKNLTATLIFTENLSLFTGTDLDKNRIIAVSPRVDDGALLAQNLGGTRWLWHGKKDRVMKLRKDGHFELGDWNQQGISAVWQATGPREVTVTVISPKFRDLTATLVFDGGLTSFTGTDLDKKRQVVRSPRVDH